MHVVHSYSVFYITGEWRHSVRLRNLDAVSPGHFVRQTQQIGCPGSFLVSNGGVIEKCMNLLRVVSVTTYYKTGGGLPDCAV